MKWCIELLLLLFVPQAPLPDFAGVQAAWQPSDAWVLDRHGVVLEEARIDFSVRRLHWVKLEDVPRVLIDTLVRAEDRRFFDHAGVDWIAVAGALRDRLLGESSRGASTLTMQVAARLDPGLGRGGRRTLLQKLRQARAALALERRWSKEQILEAYLNLVYFRGEFQGVAAASQFLLGKHVSGLNRRESALLAALLPAPAAPPEAVAHRACAIAGETESAGGCAPFVQLAGEVFARERERPPPANLAPHLARYLDLEPGERVRTTLDASVQKLAVELLATQLDALRDRNVRDGAALVVENDSGRVLAYVGSAGPWSRAPQVDGARAPRQAGSTLKPFLYALAIEKGYLTAASILEDLPVHLETGSGLYIPQNYDRDFRGPVSVRTALASSLNVPAVRTLVLTGVEAFRDRLNAVGYRGIVEDGEYYGYSLALGSAEVTLMEQVAAYRALARGGIYEGLRLLPGAAPGRVPARRVMNAAAAFIVADILSDDAARSVTFGLDGPLSTPFWAAAKTGTSKDMRDNWCIGFSDRFTVGVWVGNFEGDSMKNVSGISGAAPVWRELMKALHRKQPARAPAPPPGVVARSVEFLPAVEPSRREWFVQGTETSTVAVAGADAAWPRLVSPPEGTIIALDPDIPEDRQLVPGIWITY
jgi:penicillin-binding protein 1C